MKKITSVNNSLIKDIVKLHQKKIRDELGFFLVEGEKALNDILHEAVEIKYIFVLENFKSILPLNNNILISVSENVMKKLATTDSTPNILTVAVKPALNLSGIRNSDRVLLLNDIKDTGNAGTIIRSAVAFGIDLIILFGDCCDFYSPKVIRSAAGNFFKIPIMSYTDVKKMKSDFLNHCFVSTDLHKPSCSFTEIKSLSKYVLMFGSEASGLIEILSDSADKNFVLNISKNVESLNLATSVSIILYEMSKP